MSSKLAMCISSFIFLLFFTVGMNHYQLLHAPAMQRQWHTGGPENSGPYFVLQDNNPQANTPCP